MHYLKLYITVTLICSMLIPQNVITLLHFQNLLHNELSILAFTTLRYVYINHGEQNMFLLNLKS